MVVDLLLILALPLATYVLGFIIGVEVGVKKITAKLQDLVWDAFESGQRFALENFKEEIQRLSRESKDNEPS